MALSGCARIAKWTISSTGWLCGAFPNWEQRAFGGWQSFFGELENAWKAPIAELMAAGLDYRTAQSVEVSRRNLSPDGELENVLRAQVAAINWNDAAYPARLKEIADPPPVIYYKGTLQQSDERAIAIVGTRNPTTYGKEVASVLSRELAGCGLTVVSGLALGIDGVAHRAALESGGRTIAVVAGGLDSVYPAEHSGLFRQIQGQGAVISEQPLGVRPTAQSFPRRNRLISGTTLGTVVVEAAEGSGTRWTVYQALEQNREVFCVPGSIFSPASRFTNRMIQEGAKLVTSYTDILEELNLRQLNLKLDEGAPDRIGLPLPVSSPDSASGDGVPALDNLEVDGLDIEEESTLLNLMEDSPVHIDELARQAGLPMAAVNSILTMLELKGMAKQVGCMHYIRLREVGASYGS